MKSLPSNAIHQRSPALLKTDIPANRKPIITLVPALVDISQAPPVLLHSLYSLSKKSYPWFLILPELRMKIANCRESYELLSSAGQNPMMWLWPFVRRLSVCPLVHWSAVCPPLSASINWIARNQTNRTEFGGKSAGHGGLCMSIKSQRFTGSWFMQLPLHRNKKLQNYYIFLGNIWIEINICITQLQIFSQLIKQMQIKIK